MALVAAIFVTGNAQAQIPDNETHAYESLDSGKGLMPPTLNDYYPQIAKTLNNYLNAEERRIRKAISK